LGIKLKNSDPHNKNIHDRFGRIRPAVPFLIAVLISTSIWVINALNKSHSTSFTVALAYPYVNTAPEKGYTREVHCEIKGRGFDLIRFLLNKKSGTIALKDAKTARIEALDAITRHVQSFNKKLIVSRVHPLWIDPPQAQFYSRKLKLVPNTEFTAANTFVKTIPAITIPDSILIYSEIPIPANLKTIGTAPIKKGNLSTSWFGSVRIINPDPDNFIPEVEKVWVYQPIEEATEIKLLLPINPGAGIPFNFRFIPASAILTCNVPVSRYAITTADRFMITAEVNDQEQKKAIVNLVKFPSWASNIHYSPTAVEFLKINP
jgi:hypothetical protein